MKDRKLAGIWLDTTRAIIVRNQQENADFSVMETVTRDIQHGNSNENAANNSEQTTTGKFFKDIEKIITNAEELLITGPGTAQEELKHHLLDTAQFKNLKISLDTAQKMDDDDLIKATKRHFGV